MVKDFTKPADFSLRLQKPIYPSMQRAKSAIVGRLTNKIIKLVDFSVLCRKQQSVYLSMQSKDHGLEFFTATNLSWLHVLAKDYHKQILVEAMKHRTDSRQLTIHAFVIMPNHFHAIWKVHDDIDRQVFQRDLMKFTARSILKFMFMNEDPLLSKLKVKAADRAQQVWERNPLAVELFTEKVFMQKLNYIHNNPLQPKWRLSRTPEEYFYSSARFYETGVDDFGILTHYKE